MQKHFGVGLFHKGNFSTQKSILMEDSSETRKKGEVGFLGSSHITIISEQSIITIIFKSSVNNEVCIFANEVVPSYIFLLSSFPRDLQRPAERGNATGKAVDKGGQGVWKANKVDKELIVRSLCQESKDASNKKCPIKQ